MPRTALAVSRSNNTARSDLCLFTNKNWFYILLFSSTFYAAYFFHFEKFTLKELSFALKRQKLVAIT